MLWIAAAPLLLIFLMEITYKLPLLVEAIDWPRTASEANHQGGQALDGYGKRSIEARCKVRWPSDRKMQGICTEHAEAGLADLARAWIANLSLPGMKSTLRSCFVEFTTDDITDFALVGACARAQRFHVLQTPLSPLPAARDGNRIWGTTANDRLPGRDVASIRQRSDVRNGSGGGT